MGYTKHFLQKVLDVQETYKLHKKEEVKNNWIWKRYIHKQYYCSLRSMYKYLTIPAAKLLKEMEAREKAKLKQQNESDMQP